MQPDENFWKKCEGEQIANAYELEQLLGCGAFGGVFRAVQIANGRRLNKRVAVKLMLSGTIQQEELNFALDLPSHQNLVQHFGGNNVEIRGFPMFYLVMELADCSLADFVKKRGGQITSVEAKPIVRDIAQGLKYLHELDAGNSQDKRYVHRDLKLLNVLQVGGVWKIADFGLSKALDRGTMQASKIAGTPYYMPPELFRNGYVSTKWDVWSLGVMIVEMLTGHFPFEAGGNVNTEVVIKELERKIQRENPNLQGVSSEWIDVVKGCLVKDHAQRWVAADVLKALDSIGVSTPQNKPPTIPQPKPSSQKTTPVHASPSSSNGFWSKTLAIAALLCGVGFMIWQLVKPVNAPFVTSPSSSPSPKETVSSKTAEQFFNDGEIKANSKDYKGAIADFNEAIRLKSDYADAYYNRGLVKSILGDQQGAIADYNEVIRLKPDFADAYYRRGGAKDELGDKQGAIADYNEVIRLKPDYAYAYFNRGKARYDSGEKDKAITDYDEAIRLNPNDAEVYNYRGSALYNYKNDKERAILDFTKAIELNPSFALAYNNRGITNSILGKKQEALLDHSKAIQINPNDANFYYNRGNVFNDLGKKQEAISDFDKSIRLKPDYTDAYFNRGNAWNDLGNKNKAKDDYTKVIELKPDYASAYFNRGKARYDSGEKDKAITDYDEAIRLNPNDAEVYNHRGSALYNYKNDKERAVLDFTKAIELNPNFALAYDNRGTANSNLGKKEQAFLDHSKAIQIDPSYASYYYNRGNVLDDLGKKEEEAISDYNNAIRLKPDYADAYYRRGLINKKRGKKAEASPDFRKAAELYQQQGNIEWYNKSIREIGG